MRPAAAALPPRILAESDCCRSVKFDLAQLMHFQNHSALDHARSPFHVIFNSCFKRKLARSRFEKLPIIKREKNGTAERGFGSTFSWDKVVPIIDVRQEDKEVTTPMTNIPDGKSR
ncbi:MAG: hypothetical protein D6679_10145 [Candidatus Hydrogenedentota bacterium]|nr:MAG: hypothetical protein D6679_10145 [Candidatus Hydrogenedentota bacterium]